MKHDIDIIRINAFKTFIQNSSSSTDSLLYYLRKKAEFFSDSTNAIDPKKNTEENKELLYINARASQMILEIIDEIESFIRVQSIKDMPVDKAQRDDFT